MRRFCHICSATFFILVLILFNGIYHGGGFIFPTFGKYPTPTDEYLAYSNDIGTIEQTVLYKNIGNAQKRLEDSDIIFIGNSRMQMGWDINAIRAFGDTTKFHVFNLSCGNAEGFYFFYEIYLKYPFSNKVVLINVDKHFEQISGPAEALFRGSDEGYLFFLSAQTYIRIKSLCELIVPTAIQDLIDYKKSTSVIFRSFFDGFWNFYFFPNISADVTTCGDIYNNLAARYESSSLKMLIRLLQKNGCLVVLTQVPSTDSSSLDISEIGDRSDLYYINVAIAFSQHYGIIHVKSADCGGFHAQALQPDGPHFFPETVLHGRDLPGATLHPALAGRLSMPEVWLRRVISHRKSNVVSVCCV